MARIIDTSGVFFNEFAETFDTFYDKKRSRLMRWIDYRFRSDMFLRFDGTFRALGDLSRKRVLDIGCGSGPYLAEALKRGAREVVGLDPASRMLDLAKKRLLHHGYGPTTNQLCEGYFPQISPPGKFDCAIVMGVMDYVAEPVAFVRALNELISERAVLSFPSTHWFRTPFRKVRYTARRCPVYFYTHAKITALMNQAGVTHYELMKIPGAGMDFIVCIKT